ncbi:organic hydroperoxide resistance protein [Streptomyces sp. N2-109]|uniref:Organic hydroperoxide resistance protein n=1 Tax=Streptomyces gossypii TaxID=2883101 RepID=A0ABT2JMC5_9ACTN|nr:organic hydroperoxide resistance protein [Streptomyces gossypii]MCT2589033.1 organic hydroperoxide resistance protein [Streptomyces gossypii]
MTVQTLYTTEAVSAGDGRDGTVRSLDGMLDLPLAAPAELGGAGGATNPEQLFAAGYAACFHSALRLAARQGRIRLRGDTVTARVALGKDPDGFLLTAEVHVVLPALDQETAERLTHDAHQRCPYSRAVRDTMHVALHTTTPLRPAVAAEDASPPQ